MVKKLDWTPNAGAVIELIPRDLERVTEFPHGMTKKYQKPHALTPIYI